MVYVCWFGSPLPVSFFRIVLIKEYTQQAALKGTISLEVRRRKKTWKTGKRSIVEKVMGFSSASLFTASKREAVTQGKII